MKKTHSPEDLSAVKFSVNIKQHIVEDLKEMEKNTKIPVDELVAKALLMFIATHSDYLGKLRS